jgi:hypothetical protein
MRCHHLQVLDGEGDQREGRAKEGREESPEGENGGWEGTGEMQPEGCERRPMLMEIRRGRSAVHRWCRDGDGRGERYWWRG